MAIGGAEDFAASVARFLPKPFEAVFVCLRDYGAMGEELRRSGREIHLVPVAPGKRWNLAGIWELARWYRHEGIRAVHSQTYNSHTYAIPAARLAGIGSVIHQQKTYQRLRIHRMIMMRGLCSLTSRVAALSEETRRDLAHVFRIARERTCVIPNVVDDAEFFRASEEERAELRRRLGLDPKTFLIGSIGSLHAVKHHEATLRMLARLRDEGIPFSAILLGEGPGRPSLEALRGELGLDRIVQLPGIRRPVAPWLRAMDIMVHPSWWEGQPLALLQAVACEIPVLASLIEGNVAVLGPSHPGLFPPESLDAYAALAGRCIRAPAFRTELLFSQARIRLPTARVVAAELAGLYNAIAAPA